MVVVIGELAGDIGVFIYERSSPRMRGTRHGRGVDAALPGIIPAYAGNTRPEHHIVPVLRGSSPRMRGTLGEHLLLDKHTGIIPAYAGNTSSGHVELRTYRDHPRVCGEHTMRNFPYLRDEGSSPRMRGTPSQWFTQAVVTGIIPAYAGNTCVPIWTNARNGDHPRVCGEHKTTLVLPKV